MEYYNTIEAAKSVLKENDKGKWTIPSTGLYPHQWLWDSCFIAIGLRHIDVERAQLEIRSLLKGQWENGMIPHMIFSDKDEYKSDAKIWNSKKIEGSPKHLSTSGITQPPIICEAVVKIGEKLDHNQRIEWYEEVFPNLVRYHAWLYSARNPKHSGLLANTHPYETGLDNTPPWIYQMRKFAMPLWVKIIGLLRLDFLFSLFRRDIKHSPAKQRMDTVNILAYFSLQRKIKHRKYNSIKILNDFKFLLEDVSFNSIAVRNNELLRQISKEINTPLPPGLASHFDKAKKALDDLWDEKNEQYYSRTYFSHRKIKESSIATFLPLYAGTISKARAKQLLDILKSKSYGTDFLVASVPTNSKYYDPDRYWRGPSWINTNWLIANGLRRYGYETEAKYIEDRSIAMTSMHGMYEYFDSSNGTPAGASNFSWTAALILDMLQNKYSDT